jgi:thiol-disulfide isomerase/thioredoxin
VKGEAVANFQKGRVYVVEFWATWCLPCRASLPHLTQLQKDHKDITVICIAGSERVKPQQPDERLSNLRKFVQERERDMGFRVAYDSSSTMISSWLTAAGQRGIPCGFVVDGEGKIAYVGYPMDKAFEKAFVSAVEKAATPTKTAAMPAVSADPATLAAPIAKPPAITAIAAGTVTPACKTSSSN